MKLIALVLLFTAGTAVATPSSRPPLSEKKNSFVLALGNNDNTCTHEYGRCGNNGDADCCGDLTCQQPDGEAHYICLP